MLHHRSEIKVIMLIFCMMILESTLGPMSAFAEPAVSPMTPMAFIDRYERSKQGASLEKIEAYGQEALKLKGAERLTRLLYVVDTLQGIEEPALYEKWFAIANKIAISENQDRFKSLFNLIKLEDDYFFSNNDPKFYKKINFYTNSDDLILKSISMMVINSLDDASDQSGRFKKLVEVYQVIPKSDPLAHFAYRIYWGRMLTELVKINDVDGAVDAASKHVFTYAIPGLLVPDSGIINGLTIMARRLDDEPLARRAFLAQYHMVHADPTPSNLANLSIDCAELETTFQKPDRVLACLNGADLDAAEPNFRKVVGLSLRARALAQVGQTVRAEADLAELDDLKASGTYHPGSFAYVPLAKAEVMANRGQSKEAIQIVSNFWRSAAKAEVRRFRDAVPNLVGRLRADVVELRKTADLQKTVIALQGLFAGLAIAVALAAIYAVFYLRRLNRKLEAARLSAEEANRAKSLFLANISHEIRTPLNGVLGLAQAISADELTPVQAERIGVLRQSGLGLLAILNDLLDLAKIEAGKLTIEAVPFNPQEVLTAARQAIWATAEAKGITVEARVMAEAEGLFKGDPTRLRQIIDNLVSNAVKFTPTGRVDVVLSRPTDALVLTVADTGIGMTPEAVNRIFMKFEQADVSTTRRFGGSGLGLSICLELVEAMGGAIKADSVEGQGTTFTMILPLERLGDVPDVVTVQQSEPVVDTDQPPLRVLAAEDHPVNQLVLRTLLGQFGVDVTMASDGQEVLDLFKTHDWDVVLMDVQMPVMDGPTATRAIRQFERDQARRPTPILALTANAMAHQLDDYRQAGCNGHVSKPIDATDLISAMGRVLAEADEVNRSEAVVI
ncbi:MAG: hypothetical protein RJA87_1713 [Pseudomonadota bacterium]|jgi:signal transduction histidine kinase/ActR/RegA family two-component response regulator